MNGMYSENGAILHSPDLQKIWEFAASFAELIVWKYDIIHHRITFFDPASAEKTAERFALPAVIENVPDSLTYLIETESTAAFLEMYRKIADGAPDACCEVWYKAKPGKDPICDRITYKTVYDSSHHPVEAYGLCKNITEQKQAEQKYARTYKLLSYSHPYPLGSFHLNLTRNTCGNGQSPLPFVLKQQESGTADGYFDEFAKLIADTEIKKQFFETFQREKLIALFQSGTTSTHIEYPIIYEDGNVYWRDGLLYMLENPVTHDIEAVTYAVDINMQKKTELAIEAAMASNYDYIALIYPSTQKTEFLSFKHYSRTKNFLHTQTPYNDDVGYFITHYVLPEERAWFTEKTQLQNLIQELENTPVLEIPFRQISEDGAEARKLLRYRWLDHFKRDIVVIQTDITISYKQEQQRLAELQAALQQAQSANKAKTEFISRISHDIRTPISAISNMTAFAIQDMDNRVKLQNDLEKIKTSNLFLLSLINDVLDISKIDSGKIELHPEPYPFDEYIANIKQMFEPLCQQKGIGFIVVHTPDCGIIIADKIRINQIVFNIISNSVKYTPPGGTISYDSHSRNMDNGKIKYEYTVRDTGIGISEEYQKKLFVPFTQDYANPNRQKGETGTGLGLSIVKRLVDMMGGTITVSSTVGKGTNVTVSMELPMMTAEEFRNISRQTASKHEMQKQKLTGTVLLAEDNEINREIAVRILEDFGLSVTCAENGKDALETFKNTVPGTFRAILMDLQMPVMDGYESAEKIRALARGDSKTIPIYAMTADAFSEAAERCRKSGMNAQIIKPIDPSLLYDILSRRSNEYDTQ